MHRYTKSFGITLLIYAAVTITFIYSHHLKLTSKEQATPEETALKIAVIQFQKSPKTTIHEKQSQQKKTSKPKPIKKIIEKKPLTQKKPIKNTMSTPKVTPKKIIKEPIIKPQPKKVIKSQPNLLATKPIQKKESPTPIVKPSIDAKQLEQQKQEYYSKIKQIINKHKSYPRIAVRRGIEGLIKINFTLSNTGELLSYDIIEGKNIFNKSVIEAIQQSFPLLPPQNLFTGDIDISLTLDYKLY